MNGETISSIIENDPVGQFFLHGYLAVDSKIPKILFYPALFILNTDKEKGPGKHWCILLVCSPKYAEFFDSFGFSPQYYGFHKELLRHMKTIHFNEYPVQSATSATCGHHCIFWSLLRIRGTPAETIMRKYSKNNLKKNDKMVYEYVKKNFGAKKAKIVF